jgi:multidrug efflux pump subunit AcrA (membrane-fusion protein)
MAEVDNRDGALKGGLFVKGRILTGTRAQVLAVPRSALLTWDIANRRAEVYTVDGDVARRRSIVTGAALGESVEVVSGLAAGDVVVTRGSFNLRDGDRIVVAGV